MFVPGIGSNMMTLLCQRSGTYDCWKTPCRQVIAAECPKRPLLSTLLSYITGCVFAVLQVHPAAGSLLGLCWSPDATKLAAVGGNGALVLASVLEVGVLGCRCARVLCEYRTGVARTKHHHRQTACWQLKHANTASGNGPARMPPCSLPAMPVQT